MRIRFNFYFLAFFAVILIAAACTKVSEDSPDLPNRIAEVSELTAAASEPVSVTKQFTEPSETVTSAAETEELPAGTTVTSAAKTEKTQAETTGTSAKITETAPKTAKRSETTARETYVYAETSETKKITIQPESPPETAAVTASAAAYVRNGYNALNYQEQKGFWITYLEYGTILRNKSESSFKKSVGEYFDNISALGFNTVYVQVRAFGDAYYDSELYPSGEQFDGTIGTKKRFDALRIMTECAHARGLSIHAWVNPMRLMSEAQIKNIDGKYPIKKWYDNSSLNGKYIVESGGRLYLNPAYDEVTDLIAAGIAEIAANYDVDGIQIDDYFYPTTAESFDSVGYSSSGTKLPLGKWRTANVSKMVKKLYNAVHTANSTAVFGISPQGSVENNYNELYADVGTWCSESGYCDYILPQVYFGFDSALPYADVISQWSGMVSNPDVKLVIGLAAYKIGAADGYAGARGKNEWIANSDIISRQMILAKALGNYGGVAIYRYDSLFNPSSDVAAQVDKEIKNIEKQ